MRKSGNEVSALLRRADRLEFVSEAVGILSFIPLGGSAFWASCGHIHLRGVAVLRCGACGVRLAYPPGSGQAPVRGAYAWQGDISGDHPPVHEKSPGGVCRGGNSPGNISRDKKKMSALQWRGYVRRKRSLPDGVSGKARHPNESEYILTQKIKFVKGYLLCREQ